ncbi:F0F1 ATP synthase subunit delta [Sphingobacterium shayense]|uniref:F0F1 ATP synthase subunit delta n=1 Tax=Sphingobacterium shayense TaxID=626343 RepID=UPI001551847F|nr:F0F1 ATP synthase subunit delta [Sphingobacterium shayense]NQD72246.1 F0F1 ATP synthase subunit delta [Sphingobacterium shayense]
MSIFTVASRYAKSLLDLSKEQGSVDAVKGDIDQVIAVLKENSQLQKVLKNPIIQTDKKQSILAGIFEGKINPLILSFFGILVSKGRANILFEIATEFIRSYNELNGIVNATVISAVPLSPETLSELKNTIAQDINRQVILKNNIDSSLIGGIIVRVGDKQIDASIAGRLSKLEKHFVTRGA